jgi:hypothetical protein
VRLNFLAGGGGEAEGLLMGFFFSNQLNAGDGEFEMIHLRRSLHLKDLIVGKSRCIRALLPR